MAITICVVKYFKIYFFFGGQINTFDEGYHDPHHCINQAPSLTMGIYTLCSIYCPIVINLFSLLNRKSLIEQQQKELFKRQVKEKNKNFI